MLEEFDQFFIPLSQKSCYSADPPPICWRKFGNQNANHNIFFFFLDCQVIKGSFRELHSALQDHFNCEFS